MNLKKALGLYAAVFLLALPLTLPARLLFDWIELPDTVKPSAIEGTALSARLPRVVVSGISLVNVRASLSVWGLFSGRPIRLAFSEPLELTARIGGSEKGLDIASLEVKSSLQTLLGLMNVPGLGLDASVALSVDEASIHSGQCSALTGTLSVSQFEGNLQGVESLGEINAILSCEAGQVMLKVEPDNRLKLAGTAMFSPEGRYRVEMTAEPAPGPLFESFVDLMGPPRDGRRFNLNFRS